MHASLVALLALAATASAQFAAQPLVRAPPVPVYDYQHIQDDHGQYSVAFATGAGATHTDHGFLRQGPEGPVLIKQGTYAYTSPEGKVITAMYTADEAGFHITGNHLPVAPAPIV